MHSRGRPPYPDILTPREWEVLDLLDEGLTNDQIAERLGISPNGAKFHVAQILAKLGVESRKQAPRVAYANRGARVRRWSAIPFLGALGSSKSNAVAAGGIVAAVGVALVLLFFALRDRSAAEPFDFYSGIYVLDAATGKVERIVDLREGDRVQEYHWTADGAAFIAHRSAGRDASLQRFDSKSGNLVAQDSLNAGTLNITMLKDGAIGTVFRSRVDQDNSLNMQSGIAVLDPETLEPRFLLETGVEPSETAWMPDGSSVAVYTNLEASVAEDRQSVFRRLIVSLGQDSSAIPHEAPISWSPDGSLSATLQSFGTTATLTIRRVGTDDVLGSFSLPVPIAQEVVWSPDGRWLALQGETGLLLLPTDGSAAPRQIADGHFHYGTTNPFGPGQPSWSPDSRYIAYVSDDAKLWQVDVLTGDAKLFYTPPVPSIAEPRWSPDGTKIAFRVVDSPGIYATNLAGESRYIASGRNAQLSPDGSPLLMTVRDNVYRLRSNGRGLTELHSGPLPEFVIYIDRLPPCVYQQLRPNAWSPDGRSVLAIDWTGMATVVSAYGTSPMVFIVPGVNNMEWSPDGTRFARVSFLNKNSVGSCEVVMTDTAGVELARLRGNRFIWLASGHLAVLTPFEPITSPEWVVLDADGRQVTRLAIETTFSPRADVALVVPEDGDAWLVDINNGAVLQTYEGVRRAAAHFSADGEYLALHNIETGRLHLLNGRTGAEIRSVQFGGAPDFSDNHTLAFTVRDFNTGMTTLYFLDINDPSSAPREVAQSFTIAARTWSPESTHYAFISDGLIIVDRSTITPVHVAPRATNLQWFPNGRELLYSDRSD